MPPEVQDKEIVYEGTAVSPGIAFAPLHVVARGFAAAVRQRLLA